MIAELLPTMSDLLSFAEVEVKDMSTDDLFDNTPLTDRLLFFLDFPASVSEYCGNDSVDSGPFKVRREAVDGLFFSVVASDSFLRNMFVMLVFFFSLGLSSGEAGLE